MLRPKAEMANLLQIGARIVFAFVAYQFVRRAVRSEHSNRKYAITGRKESNGMELRNHPKMRFEGKPNWPPHWLGSYSHDHPLPRGEIGVLREVYSKPANSIIIRPRCYLVIDHEGREYFASLLFDDLGFLETVCRLLQRYIGTPISSIGSLVIP